MKKEEKALLKDIAGMIGKLIDMSGKEENQQQAAEESAYNAEEESNNDDHEEDDIDVDFVKGMFAEGFCCVKFLALCSDGSFSGGIINKRTFDAMCNAFLEKYA